MLNSFSKSWLGILLLWIMLVGCAQTGTIEHEIRVQAVDTGASISKAMVRAEIGARDSLEAVSDADGKAQLTFDEEYLDRWAKVIIEAEGYQRKSILVKLLAESPTSTVRLDPIVGETLLEQPADEASTSANGAAVETSPPAGNIITETAESNAETPNDTAASTVTISAGELANVPPSQRANYYQAKPNLAIDTDKIYRATIKTTKGDIVVSLDATAAPEHVNNFIFLSNQGFYDGLTFHRVEPGFVIQGGDPEGSGQGGPGYTIPGEFNLTHVEGALAMARLPDQINPNRESSGSQFYITLAPTPFLDGQYSVFGKVEEGMDVVQSMQIGDVIERIIVEP